MNISLILTPKDTNAPLVHNRKAKIDPSICENVMCNKGDISTQHIA